MITGILSCDKSSFSQKEITQNYFFPFALLTCKFAICLYMIKKSNFGRDYQPGVKSKLHIWEGGEMLQLCSRTIIIQAFYVWTIRLYFDQGFA